MTDTPDDPIAVPFGVDSYGNPGAVAAGELIESSWGTNVASRVAARFPNKAALDGWTTAPAGALGITLDNIAIYIRVGAAWRLTAAGGLQSGVSLATTDTNGLGSFSFNAVFPTVPNVVANVRGVGASGLIVVINTVSVGGFIAYVTSHTGAPFVGSVNLSWIATTVAL